MTDYLDKYRNALKVLQNGIREAEVNSESTSSILIGINDGEVVSTSFSDSTEIFVRTTHGHTGYAYTQDLNEEPAEVFKRALGNSDAIEISHKDALNTKESSFNAFVRSEKELESADELIEALKKIADTISAADEKIAHVSAKLRVNRNRSIVMNSRGVDCGYERTVYRLSVSVAANDGNQQYNTTVSVDANSLEMLDIEDLKERIQRKVRSFLKPVPLKSGIYSALLDSSVVLNIMITAWQIFSGMKYNSHSSCLAEKLTKKIGSEQFNVMDTVSHEKTGYIFLSDCEGTRAADTVLVKNGQFLNVMHNLSSAEASGAKANGYAGRYALLSGTVPTDIIITPHIIRIQEGEKSIDELLIMLQDGVHITDSFDIFHSINIASGDFSIPCRGVVVKEGKVDHAVTGMTISGNLIELFNNIVEVGNDLHIDEFLRQSYCFGGPSILLRELQVNGE